MITQPLTYYPPKHWSQLLENHDIHTDEEPSLHHSWHWTSCRLHCPKTTSHFLQLPTAKVPDVGRLGETWENRLWPVLRGAVWRERERQTVLVKAWATLLLRIPSAGMHSASQSKLRFIYSGRTGIDSQTSLTANSIIRTKQRTFHSLTFRPSDPLSRSSTACIILLLSQVNSSHGKYNHERTSKRLCHSRIMKTMICGNTGSNQTKQRVATVKSGANIDTRQEPNVTGNLSTSKLWEWI